MRLSKMRLARPLSPGQPGGLSWVRLGPAEGHLLYRGEARCHAAQ